LGQGKKKKEFFHVSGTRGHCPIVKVHLIKGRQKTNKKKEKEEWRIETGKKRFANEASSLRMECST